MARYCNTCDYRVEDRWASNCPICGGGLSGGGYGAYESSRSGFDLGSSGGRTLIYTIIGGIVLLTGGGFLINQLLGWNQPAAPAPAPTARQVDSTGKIRVGMPMHDVAGVLDAEAGRDPAHPSSLSARLPAGTTKGGSLAWERNGRALYIDFEQGRVTSIDEEVNPRSNRTMEDLEFND